MQITRDESAHDAFQRYLVGIIASDVRDMLHAAAAKGASLEEAVKAITFGVTAIIDGSRIMDMERDGKAVTPVLMFGLVDEDDGAESIGEVITSGEPTFMHEYAQGAADEVLRASGDIPAVVRTGGPAEHTPDVDHGHDEEATEVA